jgi:hypothetical protein
VLSVNAILSFPYSCGSPHTRTRLNYLLVASRYGDYTPKSDLGKLAVAAYAVLVVNVVAGLLKPGRMYLEDLCRVKLITVTKKLLPVTTVTAFPKKAVVKED